MVFRSSALEVRLAGIMLIGHSKVWSSNCSQYWAVLSSKTSDFMSLLVTLELGPIPFGIWVVRESEIKRSLATSQQGKRPAIHPHSLVSEISEGISMDSSEARYPGGGGLTTSLSGEFIFGLVCKMSPTRVSLSGCRMGPVPLVCES